MKFKKYLVLNIMKRNILFATYFILLNIFCSKTAQQDGSGTVKFRLLIKLNHELKFSKLFMRQNNFLGPGGMKVE